MNKSTDGQCKTIIPYSHLQPPTPYLTLLHNGGYNKLAPLGPDADSSHLSAPCTSPSSLSPFPANLTVSQSYLPPHGRPIEGQVNIYPTRHNFYRILSAASRDIGPFLRAYLLFCANLCSPGHMPVIHQTVSTGKTFFPPPLNRRLFKICCSGR